jgi:hypothetical protein
MKKALIEKVKQRPEDGRYLPGTLRQVVGPMNPDTGAPITADTAFPAAPGFEWRDCGDEVTLETHVFDGTHFVPKPASD